MKSFNYFGYNRGNSIWSPLFVNYPTYFSYLVAVGGELAADVFRASCAQCGGRPPA
jgi:hypothetical protein